MATKTTAKKTTLPGKKASGSKMPQAHAEQCFWVHYGPVLSNPRDLEHALTTMSDEQFKHHVNKMKNDFSAWVKDVLRDADLAQKLAHSKTRDAAAKTVKAHIQSRY